MDMLPFTDDIHKRSASYITACLKSDSTLVRSIAEFGIIVGCCMTAGWNCFRMATAVRSSVELVMTSCTASNVADVRSQQQQFARRGPWGRNCLQRLLDQCAYLMVFY